MAKSSTHVLQTEMEAADIWPTSAEDINLRVPALSLIRATWHIFLFCCAAKIKYNCLWVSATQSE